jgi:hypothetical protein
MENNVGTNINQLPVDPTCGGQTNISMSVNELQNNAPQNNSNIIPQNQPNNNSEYDQQTLNRIINDIQQAANSGNTKLPSRDIPLNTNNIINDPNIQPNYIPEPNNNNNQKDQLEYMRNYYSNEDVIKNYNKNKTQQNTIDNTFNEFQIPLLLSVMYFLFQMPILKNKLFSFLPSLFSKDANYNLNGYVFMSMMFGGIYYIVDKYVLNVNVF